jgi:hypothetical protein
MSMFTWREVDPAPGEPVAPDERLPWGKTVGLGAQHVVAMFGATFVFPLVMGLDPNLAIMFSGICTILFLLITSNKVPSYLGTSASFVASVAAIRAQGGDSADVTGSILVAVLVVGGLPDRPQDVGGVADVRGGDHPDGLLDGQPPGREVRQLAVVAVALGDRLLKDRRVGGHAHHVLLVDQLRKVAGRDPLARQVVQPDRDAFVGEALECVCHGICIS